MGNIWKTKLSIISNFEIVLIARDASVWVKQRVIYLNGLCVGIAERGKRIGKDE